MDSLLNDVEYQEIYETLAGTERGQAFLNTFAEKHKGDDANNLQSSDEILSEADQPIAVDLDEDEETDITPEISEAEIDLEVAEADAIEVAMAPEDDLEIGLADDMPVGEIEQESDQDSDLDFSPDDTTPDEDGHAEDLLAEEVPEDTPVQESPEHTTSIDDTPAEDTSVQETDAQDTDAEDEDPAEEDATPIDLDLLQVEAPLEAGEVVVEGDQEGVPEDMSQNAPEPDSQPSAEAAPMIDDINISAQSETEEDDEAEPQPDTSEIDELAEEDAVIEDISLDDSANENLAQNDIDQDDLDQDDLSGECELEVPPAENDDNDEAAMNSDLLQELTNLKTRISDLEEKISEL